MPNPAVGRLKRAIAAIIVALAMVSTPQFATPGMAAFDPLLEVRLADALATGSIDAAKAIIAEALAGETDPEIRADLTARMAELLQDNTMPSEAGDAWRDLATAEGIRLGEGDPSLISIWSRAATQFEAAGRAEDAADALVRALEIARTAGIADQMDTLMERLGAIAEATDNVDLANAILESIGEHEMALEETGKRAFPTDPDKGFSKVRIYYATDRARSGSSLPTEFYGGTRGELDYGTAEISVPRRHQPGQIEKPSIWTFDFREDPERHIVLASVTPQPKDAVFAQMRKHLGDSAAKEAFVFVHGFNVPFHEAAMRTAQMAFDMNFDGLPILFSWPSRGSVLSYIADTAVVNLSGRRLSRFLEDVVAQSGATRIHLIAHSMGNRALTDALELYALRHQGKPPAFDQVLFTAPDLDAGLFAEMMETIRTAAHRITLYASNKDWALAVSRRLHGDAARAGQGGSNIVHSAAIDSIDMTDVGEDMLAHGYYANNPSALTDILSLFWRDAPPEDRCGMVAEAGANGAYWQYRPDLCDSDALLSTLSILRKSGVASVSEARRMVRRFIMPVTIDPTERSRIEEALGKLLGG